MVIRQCYFEDVDSKHTSCCDHYTIGYNIFSAQTVHENNYAYGESLNMK